MNTLVPKKEDRGKSEEQSFWSSGRFSSLYHNVIIPSLSSWSVTAELERPAEEAQEDAWTVLRASICWFIKPLSSSVDQSSEPDESVLNVPYYDEQRYQLLCLLALLRDVHPTEYLGVQENFQYQLERQSTGTTVGYSEPNHDNARPAEPRSCPINKAALAFFVELTRRGFAEKLIRAIQEVIQEATLQTSNLPGVAHAYKQEELLTLTASMHRQILRLLTEILLLYIARFRVDISDLVSLIWMLPNIVDRTTLPDFSTRFSSVGVPSAVDYDLVMADGVVVQGGAQNTRGGDSRLDSHTITEDIKSGDRQISTYKLTSLLLVAVINILDPTIVRWQVETLPATVQTPAQQPTYTLAEFVPPPIGAVEWPRWHRELVDGASMPVTAATMESPSWTWLLRRLLDHEEVTSTKEFWCEETVFGQVMVFVVNGVFLNQPHSRCFLDGLTRWNILAHMQNIFLAETAHITADEAHLIPQTVNSVLRQLVHPVATRWSLLLRMEKAEAKSRMRVSASKLKGIPGKTILLPLLRLLNQICRLLPSAATEYVQLVPSLIENFVSLATTERHVVVTSMSALGDVPEYPRLFTEILLFAAVILLRCKPQEARSIVTKFLSQPGSIWFHFPSFFTKIHEQFKYVLSGQLRLNHILREAHLMQIQHRHTAPGQGSHFSADAVSRHPLPAAANGRGDSGVPALGAGHHQHVSFEETARSVIRTYEAVYRFASSRFSARLYLSLPLTPPGLQGDSLPHDAILDSVHAVLGSQIGGSCSRHASLDLLRLKAAALETLCGALVKNAGQIWAIMMALIDLLPAMATDLELSFALQTEQSKISSSLGGTEDLMTAGDNGQFAISLMNVLVTYLTLLGYRRRYGDSIRDSLYLDTSRDEVSSLRVDPLHDIYPHGSIGDAECGPKLLALVKFVTDNVLPGLLSLRDSSKDQHSSVRGFTLRMSPSRYWRLAALMMKFYRLILRGPLPLTGVPGVDAMTREPFIGKTAVSAATSWLLQKFLMLDSHLLQVVMCLTIAASHQQTSDVSGVCDWELESEVPWFQSAAAASRFRYQTLETGLDILRILLQRDTLFILMQTTISAESGGLPISERQRPFVDDSIMAALLGPGREAAEQLTLKGNSVHVHMLRRATYNTLSAADVEALFEGSPTTPDLHAPRASVAARSPGSTGSILTPLTPAYARGTLGAAAADVNRPSSYFVQLVEHVITPVLASAFAARRHLDVRRDQRLRSTAVYVLAQLDLRQGKTVASVLLETHLQPVTFALQNAICRILENPSWDDPATALAWEPDEASSDGAGEITSEKLVDPFSLHLLEISRPLANETQTLWSEIAEVDDLRKPGFVSSCPMASHPQTRHLCWARRVTDNDSCFTSAVSVETSTFLHLDYEQRCLAAEDDVMELTDLTTAMHLQLALTRKEPQVTEWIRSAFLVDTLPSCRGTTHAAGSPQHPPTEVIGCSYTPAAAKPCVLRRTSLRTLCLHLLERGLLTLLREPAAAPNLALILLGLSRQMVGHSLPPESGGLPVFSVCVDLTVIHPVIEDDDHVVESQIRQPSPTVDEDEEDEEERRRIKDVWKLPALQSLRALFNLLTLHPELHRLPIQRVATDSDLSDGPSMPPLIHPVMEEVVMKAEVNIGLAVLAARIVCLLLMNPQTTDAAMHLVLVRFPQRHELLVQLIQESWGDAQEDDVDCQRVECQPLLPLRLLYLGQIMQLCCLELNAAMNYVDFVDHHPQMSGRATDWSSSASPDIDRNAYKQLFPPWILSTYSTDAQCARLEQLKCQIIGLAQFTLNMLESQALAPSGTAGSAFIARLQRILSELEPDAEFLSPPISDIEGLLAPDDERREGLAGKGAADILRWAFRSCSDLVKTLRGRQDGAHLVYASAAMLLPEVIAKSQALYLLEAPPSPEDKENDEDCLYPSGPRKVTDPGCPSMHYLGVSELRALWVYAYTCNRRSLMSLALTNVALGAFDLVTVMTGFLSKVSSSVFETGVDKAVAFRTSLHLVQDVSSYMRRPFSVLARRSPRQTYLWTMMLQNLVQSLCMTVVSSLAELKDISPTPATAINAQTAEILGVLRQSLWNDLVTMIVELLLPPDASPPKGSSPAILASRAAIFREEQSVLRASGAARQGALAALMAAAAESANKYSWLPRELRSVLLSALVNIIDMAQRVDATVIVGVEPMAPALTRKTLQVDRHAIRGRFTQADAIPSQVENSLFMLLLLDAMPTTSARPTTWQALRWLNMQDNVAAGKWTDTKQQVTSVDHNQFIPTRPAQRGMQRVFNVQVDEDLPVIFLQVALSSVEGSVHLAPSSAPGGLVTATSSILDTSAILMIHYLVTYSSNPEAANKERGTLPHGPLEMLVNEPLYTMARHVALTQLEASACLAPGSHRRQLLAKSTALVYNLFSALLRKTTSFHAQLLYEYEQTDRSRQASLLEVLLSRPCPDEQQELATTLYQTMGTTPGCASSVLLTAILCFLNCLVDQAIAELEAWAFNSSKCQNPLPHRSITTFQLLMRWFMANELLMAAPLCTMTQKQAGASTAADRPLAAKVLQGATSWTTTLKDTFLPVVAEDSERIDCRKGGQSSCERTEPSDGVKKHCRDMSAITRIADNHQQRASFMLLRLWTRLLSWNGTLLSASSTSGMASPLSSVSMPLMGSEQWRGNVPSIALSEQDSQVFWIFQLKVVEMIRSGALRNMQAPEGQLISPVVTE